MSGKIEISRELAEQALRFLMSPGDGWEAGQIAQELRAILAAPVVERQELVRLLDVAWNAYPYDISEEDVDRIHEILHGRGLNQ